VVNSRQPAHARGVRSVRSSSTSRASMSVSGRLPRHPCLCTRRSRGELALTTSTSRWLTSEKRSNRFLKGHLDLQLPLVVMPDRVGVDGLRHGVTGAWWGAHARKRPGARGVTQASQHR
jgi:hypothetical protein